VIAGLVLVALVLAARFTQRRGALAGYVLAAVSLLWLAVDKRMEGPTLLALDEHHGLTAADLAGLVGLGLGIHQAWPDVVRRWRHARG
jgi:hypothetical protein